MSNIITLDKQIPIEQKFNNLKDTVSLSLQMLCSLITDKTEINIDTLIKDMTDIKKLVIENDIRLINFRDLPDCLLEYNSKTVMLYLFNEEMIKLNKT